MNIRDTGTSKDTAEFARHIYEVIDHLDRSTTDDDRFIATLKEHEWKIKALLEFESSAEIQQVGNDILNLLRGNKQNTYNAKALCNFLMYEIKKLYNIQSRNKKLANNRYGLRNYITIITSVITIIISIVILLFGNIILERSFGKNINKPDQTEVAQSKKAKGNNEYISWEDSNVEIGIYIAHIAIISLFIILRYTKFGNPGQKYIFTNPYASDSFIQFLRGWTFIWLSWLLLYIWNAGAYGIAYLFKDSITKTLYWSVADGLNILSSVAFFNLFLVLDVPSVSSEKYPRRNDQYISGLVLVSTIAAIVLLISIAERTGMINLENSGILALSFFTAISMAFLFGRLDSHIFDIDRWMLAPLYFYVVIQVNWADFGNEANNSQHIVLISLALLLKIYIFIAVNYWLHNNKIQFYLDSTTDPEINPPIKSKSGVE